jgi:hypothetical protein
MKLDICSDRATCGGILYLSRLGRASAKSEPVTAITGLHNLVAVAHVRFVSCWMYGEAGGWELVGTSPHLDIAIEKLAMNVKLGSRIDASIAVSAGPKIKLWEFPAGQTAASSPPPHSVAASAATNPSGEPNILSFDLSVPVDDLFFIGNQLVATSQKGKIGVRNADRLSWQVQDLKPINTHDRAGSLLLLGCADGSIYYIDLEKFPLRMKDNDLLVNHFYSDPNAEPITALSVYVTTGTAVEKCIEIAYGTQYGTVRVIIQVCSFVIVWIGVLSNPSFFSRTAP